MTHVLVKKSTDVKDGMIEAGDFINGWMIDHGGAGKDHDDFFEMLFDKMTTDGNTVEVRDGADKTLTKQNRLIYRFTGGRMQIRPTDDSKGGNNLNMTIPVPSTNPNMIDSYIGTLADHIVQLSGGNAASDQAKKYLLAVIFLNRCQ